MANNSLGTNSFYVDGAELLENIGFSKEKFITLIYGFADTNASKIEAYMKKNRPWTDRTGAAKATLNAKALPPTFGKQEIRLAHGVYYGIYLETMKEGMYAIVLPTMRAEGQRCFNDLQDLLDELRL